MAPEQVQRLFIDDGSNTPGSSLAIACESASRRADMILRPAGWDVTSIQQLVENDDAVKDALCDMAMHFGTKRRTEWYTDGKPPFQAVFKEAITTLQSIGQADLRPASESAAGPNPTYEVRVNVPEEPQFVFAPSSGRPSPGGY